MIIPLRKPLPLACADALYDYFAECFGRRLDTACLNLDHLYFLPACPPDTISCYQHFSHEGPCFDGAFLRKQGQAPRSREDGARASLVGRLPTALPPMDVATLPVSARIKTLIKTRRGSYPSRSEAVFAVVQALIRAGLDDERIASVLLDPDHRISDKP